MTPQETLFAINSDMPSIPCQEGCVDCCSVALWSQVEWDNFPPEEREKLGKQLGVVKVPMRIFGQRRWALLPVPISKMMDIASRPRMAVTEWTTDRGLLLTSYGLEGVSCIFREEGKGCSIYEYRPFICRVMGLASCQGLSCIRNIMPDTLLLPHQIQQRFLMWSSLFTPTTNQTQAPQEVTLQ